MCCGCGGGAKPDSSSGTTPLPGADGSLEGLGVYTESEGYLVEIKVFGGSIDCVDTNVFNGMATTDGEDPCEDPWFEARQGKESCRTTGTKFDSSTMCCYCGGGARSA